MIRMTLACRGKRLISPAACILTMALPVAAQERPRLVLQITVDQLRGDLIDRFGQGLGPDGFNRLLEGGLHFAQARLAEICGDAAEARRQRNEANRLMARLLPYDPMADARLAGRILDRFPTPAPAPAAAPPGTGPDAAPAQFFIIGLPRSGTTLAEAILAAHPAVAALGERSAAGRLLQPVIDADLPFDAAAIARFRDGDRALLPPLPPRTRAYTDKMPENYRLLGFLGAAYPRARFVLVTRDPRDVALSMWKAHFSGTALNYCYDLTAMAHRFNLFARMMAHWQAHLPGRILTLPYEEIVQDIEGASRRLACFCGLDWLPAMTRPEENPAPVLTLTATQLRQPVHRRSVGGWRAHAEELDPFLKALDPTLWPDLPG